MAAAVQSLLSGLVVVAFFASVVLWTRALIARRSFSQWSELVPVEPQRRPFWTAADFLIMFGLFIVLAIVLGSIFAAQGWGTTPADEARSLQSLVAGLVLNSTVGAAALIITLAWLHVSHPGGFRDLQLVPTFADIRLGLVAAVYILPPVMMLAGLVSYFIPYEHQVLETLTKSPSVPLFAILFFGTAILTPFIEEFMFRVLLQGGMQGMVDHVAVDAGTWRPIAYWPIVFTSMFFALMHVGQGAAPIPLFFLSLGLGYLYRQTGRITAPLVVHMVLNGLTLCAEFTKTLV